MHNKQGEAVKGFALFVEFNISKLNILGKC